MTLLNANGISLWEKLRTRKLRFLKSLGQLIAAYTVPYLWLFSKLLLKGKPDAILGFCGGLGDDIMLTCPASDLTAKGKRVWLLTLAPALFSGVAYEVFRRPLNYRLLQQTFPKLCPQMEYSVLLGLPDTFSVPNRHILQIMADQAGCKPASYAPRLPHAQLARQPRVLVQTSALSALLAIPNKEWWPGRFAAAISPLLQAYPQVDWVQIGSPRDELIPGLRDLRGKTGLVELRELMGSSRLYIGLVGGLMHLAKAVDCPSIIVYGGRETPAQSGYATNVNLSSNPTCSPCWYYITCPRDRECMRRITSQQLQAAIRNRLDET